MIVYSETRAQFTRDVFSNQIEEKILDAFRLRLGRRTSTAEIESWKNSMQYMNNVLVAGDIPEDAGVAIEYQVPLTSKRVDFILSGADGERHDSAVIVELKQWTEVADTGKDAIVRTFVGGAEREVTHPSYQAWTYAALIRDFNVEVQEGDISLHPCAYLHNCYDASTVKSSFYREHIDQAPVFLRDDARLLRDFLQRHVRYGDRSRILYRIEHGRLRPSKNLADHLSSLLQGNREFEMIDDQKVVYETALELADQARAGSKEVLLVEGGPGTGKSVVAVNLLVEFTRRGQVAQYVSRNAAPRAVYESQLAGTFRKTHITNLFKSSGAYVDATTDSIDCLIVDEAHRLNEKSGFYRNQGDNQIKEIVGTAQLSVFFLDQDQRVTMLDIGDREAIRRQAAEAGANLTELRLESQFRCNGSDGYLSWVNNVLEIEETANPSLAGIDYDFQVFESPNELRDRIIKNTYRTLMTRGQKGCYVFCVDRETNDYFRRFVGQAYSGQSPDGPLAKAAEPAPPAYRTGRSPMPGPVKGED